LLRLEIRSAPIPPKTLSLRACRAGTRNAYLKYTFALPPEHL